MELRILFAFLLINFASGYLCPPGWLSWEDNCYYISKRNNPTRSWSQANSICQHMQAQLLYIESREEYNWLTDQMNEVSTTELLNQQWWTGLSDQQKAGKWIWSATGKGLDTQLPLKWAANYPNDHDEASCKHKTCNRCALINTQLDFVPLKMKKSSIKGLSEQSCTQTMPYICKRVNITESSSKCDYGRGWIEVGDKCWKLFSNDKRSWYEAKEQCEFVENGRLATIHTNVDQSSLIAVAHDNDAKYWIGLQVNKTGSNVSGLWTDGSSLTHDKQETFWAPQQLNFSETKYGCVYMDDGKLEQEGWHLSSCFEDRGYVCQRPQGVCPPGWATFNGRCYQFNVQNKESWDGANRHCRNQNASMFVVDTDTELLFLKSSRYLYRLGLDAVWLGFSYYATAYLWVSGARVNTSLLDVPDDLDFGNEICGLVYSDGDGSLSATDNCANKYAFICEAGADDSIIEYHHPPVDTFCPQDYFQYRARCYKLHSEAKTFDDANEACKRDQGLLATLTNSQEQAFINSHTSQLYWIGLSSWGANGQWKWVDPSQPTSYRNFMNGHNKLLKQGRNCVFILGSPGSNKGQWVPRVCSQKLPYICEKAGSKTRVTSPPPPVVDPDCGKGWRTPLSFGDGSNQLPYCYQLNKENRLWSEAQADCQGKGGQLASISTPYEQTVVESYIPYQLPGLSVWLGGSDKTTSSSWGWVDGTPFSYINWDGYLPKRASLLMCLAMNVESKNWMPENCNQKKAYFCKKPKVNQVTTTTPTPTVTTLPPDMVKTCPDTYKMIGSNCYKIYKQRSTQKVASLACGRDGAQLASVRNELENINELQTIYKTVGAVSGSKWWIGLEDRDLDGVFGWVDGTPVMFVDWGEHEPALVANGHCVVMKEKMGQWKVQSCEDLADGFICKAGTFLAASTRTTGMSTVCPIATTHTTDTACYLTAFSRFSWQTAKDSCKVNDMQLVWFDTPEETAFLIDLYQGRLYNAFWLNYQNDNGTYKMDGQPLSIDDYLPPWNKYHTGNELNRCTYLNTRAGQLYDEDCSNLLPFACKSYRTDYLPVPPKKKIGCPQKWRLVGNKCFYTFQSYSRPAKKSWYEAREHCQSLGGDLASLHADTDISQQALIDIFQNQFNQITKSSYWIGLNKLDRSKGYQWSDGSNVDMTAWNEGEPNDHRLLEACVVADVEMQWKKPLVMTWNDKYCPTGNDYVCQVPAGTLQLPTFPPTTTLPTPKMITGVQGQCDSGWVEFATQCYKFKTDYFSWHEAKKDCENEGAHLAVIHTREDNEFIVSQITSKSYGHWAIGLTQYYGMGWGWVTGAPFYYVLWAKGQPSNSRNAEMCAQIDRETGFWNDYNCALQDRGHICQKPVNGITYPPTTTMDPGVGFCKKGFQRFDNKCFGLFGADTPLTWMDAQAKCRSFGIRYDLASVLSKGEQAMVGLMTRNSNKPVWIGLSDLTGFQRFAWSNNDPIPQTYWAQGQPGYSKMSRCVELITDNDSKLGQWKAINCTEKLPYICTGPRDNTLSTPATTSRSTVCRYGYEEFEGNCYRLYKTPRSFNKATDDCHRDDSQNGFLTSILNAREEAYIQVLLTRSKIATADVWLGMERLIYNVNGKEVGQYEWQDRYPIKFARWNPGQPRHIDGVTNCVNFNVSSGLWNSVDCDPSVTKPYVCKISKTPAPTHPPTRYLCSNPAAISYRDMCYRVYTPRYGKSWHQASSECVMEGMELASIHDADVQDFLTAMIGFSDKPGPVWVGLIKSKSGSWVWSDHSVSQYENWAPGEPAERLQKQTDACAFLKFDNELSLQNGANWTADRCYASKGWICQQPADQLTAPTTSSTSTIPTTTIKQYCNEDRNWKYYNGYCYYVGNEKISWHDSNKKCKKMGAELTSLHGDDEIDAIFQGEYLYSYIAAIGLTKLGRSNWQWTDGSLLDYDNWLDGEPNNHDQSERCAFMFTSTRHYSDGGGYEKGRWNDQHCGTLGGYFCKRTETVQPATHNPAIIVPLNVGHCPTGWAHFGNRCYGLFTGVKKNWTDARDDCRSRGLNGDLVAIHSIKEQAFITSQLWDLDSNLWIGLSDRFWNGHFWWSNNAPVQFTNWVVDEPNLRETHNCVEMMLHSRTPGQWRDEVCSLKQNYMCVMDKDVRIVTTAPPRPSQLCDNGYTFYRDACYKFYPDKVGFDVADDRCNSDQATVVSINSPYEQAFVESLLAFETEPVWIGLVEVEMTMKNNLTSERFLWQDGWPVRYTLWAKGRPGPTNSIAVSCVALNPLTGEWNDTKCYYSRSFICKQSKVDPPTTTPATYQCSGKNEITFGSKCLKVGDGQKSWSDAHLSCLQMGMKLASFHSFDEGMTLMDILYRNNKVSNIWLGLIRNINGGFYWMDQTAVDWTFWSRNEPNSKLDEDACVEMVYADNGRWSDTDCERKLDYICEKPAEVVVTTTPLTTPSPTKTTTMSKPPATHHRTRTPKPTSGGGQVSANRNLGNQMTTTSPSPSGATIAVVVVLVLLLVVGMVVGGIFYLRHRRNYMSDSVQLDAFNNSASFKADKGSSDGGSLSFTNKMFNTNEAGRNDTPLTTPS